MLDYFEAYVELKYNFDALPVGVTNCEKNHGLIGNEVFNIKSILLVNKFKAVETVMLKIYEAN